MAKTHVRALSVSDLIAELNRRQRKLPTLKKLEARLERKLGQVRAEIGALVPGPAAKAKAAVRRVARRARNKIKLADAIVKVLVKDIPKSVPQIAEAVQKIGYRSVSKTFHTIIYQTLARDKRVKKAARGKYVLRG